MTKRTPSIALITLLVLTTAACDDAPPGVEPNLPPELSISSPAADAEFEGEVLLVEGVAEDDEEVARLTYTLDNLEPQSLPVEPGSDRVPFEFTLPDLEIGQHELVVAVEDLHAATDSVQLSFAVIEPPPPFETADFHFRLLGSGMERPLDITAPRGDDRIFIVEQGGLVSIYEDGVLLQERFLDVRDKIHLEGESGLLGLAFHPDYATNGYFYVYYIDDEGDTQVVRYQVSAEDPNRADHSSAKLILTAEQGPDPIHKAGSLAFGPDGMLYIPLGDGGSGIDPYGNGQNTATLLGSLLRIDVDGGDPYAIPSDNPFAESSTARPEIIAYGLRNPWQISIDEDGTIYLPDVGEATWEEVNILSEFSTAPNFGWPVMEGHDCLGGADCDRSMYQLPEVVHPHPNWCSVIGGVVYRGNDIPELRGHYVYGELCNGFVRSFRYDEGKIVDQVEWEVEPMEYLSAIGRDASGEIYVTTIRDGGLWRLERGF